MTLRDGKCAGRSLANSTVQLLLQKVMMNGSFYTSAAMGLNPLIEQLHNSVDIRNRPLTAAV